MVAITIATTLRRLAGRRRIIMGVTITAPRRRAVAIITRQAAMRQAAMRLAAAAGWC